MVARLREMFPTVDGHKNSYNRASKHFSPGPHLPRSIIEKALVEHQGKMQRVIPSAGYCQLCGDLEMKLNRHQTLTLGLVILAIGLQLHWVDSLVLTKESTRLLAQSVPQRPVQSALREPLLATNLVPNHVITPPEWLGWALMSAGAVTVLQSLAMKPDC